MKMMLMAILLLGTVAVLAGGGGLCLDPSEAAADINDARGSGTGLDPGIADATGDVADSYSVSATITGGKATYSYDETECSFSITIKPDSGYVVPKDESDFTLTDASGNTKDFSYSKKTDRSCGYITVHNVDSNLKLTGKCLKQVTVTITLNAGTTTTQSDKAVAGEGYSLTLPVKDGYNYPLSSGITIKVGTAKTEKYTYAPSTGKIVIASDAFGSSASSITITADYDPREFTLTGNIANGGLGDPSGEVEYNAEVSVKIIPDNGYGLPQTITITNGTATVKVSLDGSSGIYKYASDGTVTISKVQGNVKIDGACAAMTYKITYHLDGETLDLQPSEYTYGHAVKLPTDIGRSGVALDRWLDGDGNEMSEISSTTYGDVDVYADCHHVLEKEKSNLVYGMIICGLLLVLLVIISRK